MEIMEEDPLEGSSDLFGSLLGGITDEQWQEFQRIRELESEFVIDNDSRPGSPLFDEEVVTRIEVIHEDEQEEEIPEPMPDPEFSEDEEMAKKQEAISWGGDAALKYVNGEISFSELADIMENSKSKSRKRTAAGELKDETVDVENCSSDDMRKRKVRKPRRKACDLPKELEGLMGMANLSFAKEDKEEALRICLELIRQAPSAQQPYQTLALIYEDMGDAKQALQCSLLAAYLNPSDTDEWIKLAVASVEQSQLQQAIKCYTYAIRNEPNNINFLWERCTLYEQVGDRKNALAGYEQILQALNRPEDGTVCVEISRDIAKVHHENEDFVMAIKVLENAFSKFPSLITSEDVNFLLELQITKKCYKAALKNFVQHCGVSFCLDDAEINSHEEVNKFTEEQLSSINKCNVPDVLPIDLQVKLLVCLIHLKALNATHDLVCSLRQESPEDLGDLYLDVAEAFMEVKEAAAALPLLKDLISSEKYNLAAVWLKFGDCLNMLSCGNEAIEAYEKVLIMAPSYQEARISLSKILVVNGKKREAASALKQEYEDGKEDSVIDLHVLVERCDHLYDLEEYEEFIKAARLAQYSHCYPLETAEEFTVVLNNQSYKRRYEALRDLPSISKRVKPCFVNTAVHIKKLWDIFQKLCKKLYEFRHLQQLQDICLESMSSTLWRKDKKISEDVVFWALLSCMYNHSHKYAFVLIRDLILKNLNNNRSWNLLCLNVTASQQVRHHRFCLRLLLKNHSHLALALFNGHCAMNSGSYKHALGLYVSQLKLRPDDPQLLFLTGITYIHLACQKFATKRYILIAQAIAFLQKYMTVTKESQESLYNMARAMHQLGIKDAAVIYYKRALAAAPAAPEETYDLKHEIAYNLALLYQSSDSHHLASMLLRAYNTV